MKKFTVISVILILALICFNLYQCNKGCSPSGSSGVVTDTITYVDTIPYYKPVPRDSVVVRYITEKLPAAKEIKQEVEEPKIIVSPDSVEVVIPITQKEYKGDDYQAWVSGYKPSLDSLFVFPKTHVITIRDKPKRWGVGISTGYGYSPQGLQPYFGWRISPPTSED